MRRLAADQRHQPPHQRLQDREHQILGRERDLEVHLRELRLPIGAQVLVAEALDDLKVAIHAADHQDLLENLRRLREREELPGVDAARHQVVARALRRGLRQDGRLDLEEALFVKVAADRERRGVPENQVLLEPLTPEIEIAIAQPRLLGDIRVLVDRERGRLGVVQQADLGRDDLHLAGLDSRVDRFLRAPFDTPADPDNVFRPEPLGGLDQRRMILADNDLRDAIRDRADR